MISRAFDITDCTATYGRPRMPFREVANSAQLARPDAEDLNAAAQAACNGWTMTDDLQANLAAAYLDLQAQADLLARQLKIAQDFGEAFRVELRNERLSHETTRMQRDSYAQRSADWEMLHRHEKAAHSETLAQMARETSASIARALKAGQALEEVESERDDAFEQCGKLAAEHWTLIAAMKRITDGRGEVIDVG